ncbi:hypothetical protein W911_11780 [Hyphomicrobium nitrativorans NL23]|uniref:Uncharacterized protein n=1 Tax=Hyphomicrobium nitrativorans NL23 TaxID=1029756 RepID=V5SIA5_9HYPH|nr:hypothetical protein [Hyphomicrobium nitrativorans]AHB50232.1 hypothetical protein W911_11780 [Hyphomicrobium nitrativorans NL23]
MLFKAIAILLSTLFLAAVQMSAAGAGCSPGHGAKASVLKKSAAKQSRARKAMQMRAAAQKRKARQVQEARARKAAPPPATDTAGIVTSDDAGQERSVATTVETCTRFIASTGTTVSVPCSTE